jgi:hypothetical protein
MALNPTITFLALFAIIGLWQIPLLLSQLHGIFVGLTAYEKMTLRRKQAACDNQHCDPHQGCKKPPLSNEQTAANNVCLSDHVLCIKYNAIQSGYNNVLNYWHSVTVNVSVFQFILFSLRTQSFDIFFARRPQLFRLSLYTIVFSITGAINTYLCTSAHTSALPFFPPFQSDLYFYRGGVRTSGMSKYNLIYLYIK